MQKIEIFDVYLSETLTFIVIIGWDGSCVPLHGNGQHLPGHTLRCCSPCWSHSCQVLTMLTLLRFSLVFLFLINSTCKLQGDQWKCIIYAHRIIYRAIKNFYMFKVTKSLKLTYNRWMYVNRHIIMHLISHEPTWAWAHECNNDIW
jgi:hypothetical protein